jgi:hypothetical protein
MSYIKLLPVSGVIYRRMLGLLVSNKPEKNWEGNDFVPVAV